MLLKLPCSIYRGGTSKAVFFRKENLPAEPAARDKVLLSIFGTDKARINGIGSHAVNASKIVFVNKSVRDETDIEYTHGQVSLEKPVIDYSMNGANIAFAVGLYAVQQQLVKPTEPLTRIRTYNANTDSHLDILLSVQKESVYDSGRQQETILHDLAPGSLIELRYKAPQGETSGVLFPTGQPVDRFAVNGKEISATLIDSGNLSLLIDAHAFDLDGTETEEEQYRHLWESLRLIREQAVELLQAKCPEITLKFEESNLPKMVLVGKPASFTSIQGQSCAKEKMHLWVRDVTFNKLHLSVPASGAVTIGIASFIPGTIAQAITQFTEQEGEIRIGNPSGIYEAKACVAFAQNGWTARTASVFGTAKGLMDGNVWIEAYE